MAINSYSVVLKTKAAEGGTYTALCPIKDFPDLIGDPDTLETTTLSDAAHTYILGIQSNDLMKFTVNWDKTDCAAIKALEGTETFFQLSFSDGTTFEWKGYAMLGVPGKGVDEVLEASLNIAPTTAVSVSIPAVTNTSSNTEVV